MSYDLCTPQAFLGFKTFSVLDRIGAWPHSVVNRLMHGSWSHSKNPIFELEIAPILISLELWKTFLHGAQLICFLDNDDARHTCVRCYAHLEPANSWVEAIVESEAALCLKSWCARVGMSSKIADGSSRLDFTASCLDGVVRSKPCLDSLFQGWG